MQTSFFGLGEEKRKKYKEKSVFNVMLLVKFIVFETTV